VVGGFAPRRPPLLQPDGPLYFAGEKFFEFATLKKAVQADPVDRPRRNRARPWDSRNREVRLIAAPGRESPEPVSGPKFPASGTNLTLATVLFDRTRPVWRLAPPVVTRRVGGICQK
jgi:hypothetical protein